MIHVDIHYMGHNLVVTFEDDNEPIPYSWAVLPKQCATFIELKNEPDIAWVYATKVGIATTKAEMTAAITRAL